MDLRLERIRHPSPLVQLSGIGLDSAYVEHCWLPVVGPSVVALLRRTCDLTVSGPSRIEAVELSQLLGFGAGSNDLSANSSLGHTLARAHRFGVGRLGSVPPRFGAYEMVGPVPARLARRLPAWSRHRHSEELTRVGERLAAAGIDTSSLGASWHPLRVAATPADPDDPVGRPTGPARGDTRPLDALARRRDPGHPRLSCG
jgi:hypothetical protein